MSIKLENIEIQKFENTGLDNSILTYLVGINQTYETRGKSKTRFLQRGNFDLIVKDGHYVLSAYTTKVFNTDESDFRIIGVNEGKESETAKQRLFLKCAFPYAISIQRFLLKEKNLDLEIIQS